MTLLWRVKVKHSVSLATHMGRHDRYACNQSERVHVSDAQRSQIDCWRLKKWRVVCDMMLWRDCIQHRNLNISILDPCLESRSTVGRHVGCLADSKVAQANSGQHGIMLLDGQLHRLWKKTTTKPGTVDDSLQFSGCADGHDTGGVRG